MFHEFLNVSSLRGSFINTGVTALARALVAALGANLVWIPVVAALAAARVSERVSAVSVTLIGAQVAVM